MLLGLFEISTSFWSTERLILVPMGNRTFVKKHHSPIVKKHHSTIVKLFPGKFVGFTAIQYNCQKSSKPYSTIVKNILNDFYKKIFHL